MDPELPLNPPPLPRTHLTPHRPDESYDRPMYYSRSYDPYSSHNIPVASYHSLPYTSSHYTKRPPTIQIPHHRYPMTLSNIVTEENPTELAASRRKLQNREAQRNFRTRKEQKFKELELKAIRLNQVEEELDEAKLKNEKLSQLVEKLKARNKKYQEKLKEFIQEKLCDLSDDSCTEI